MSRLRTNPLTLTYLALLIVATATIRSLPSATQALLLQGSSTDVVNLLHTPIRVLVASAFWLPTTDWLLWLALLLLVLGSLERRVGMLRTFEIFASGHVVATLATELPIAWMVHAHLLPGSAAERSDVGVSYGFFTAVGALAGLLSRRSRMAVLGTAAGFLAISLIVDHDMTTIGHVLSLSCGLAWWPALRKCQRVPTGAHHDRCDPTGVPLRASAARSDRGALGRGSPGRLLVGGLNVGPAVVPARVAGVGQGGLVRHGVAARRHG